MAATPYFVIAGHALLIGKQPDGDSVRFVADDPATLTRLQYAERLRTSADGSVQLRFDGIDAPELHYQGASQPQGVAARDALLRCLGFTAVTYAPDGETVTAAVPPTVPLVVLARMVEINGRPVAVVLSGDVADRLRPGSGAQLQVSPELMRQSVNVWETGAGVAYPLLYTSTPPELQSVFRTAAAAARDARLGVWAADSTATFPVSDAAALGPDGVLIWPKLFRRATDYLRTRQSGQTLPEWLVAVPLQDDEVLPAGATTPVSLHTLLIQDGATVQFLADLIAVTVVER